MRRSGIAGRLYLAAVLGALALIGSGCGIAGAGGGGGAGPHGVALRVAIVANPQMQDVEALTSAFQQQHPDIKVNYVTLPENESRAKITASVSTKSNEFDVVMISNYETPMWAHYGWITNLQPYISHTPGYDEKDFIPSIRDALSYRGSLYSGPFYGESSFLMYRKDLFAKAGLKMPAHPTWTQVASFAEKLNNKKTGVTRREPRVTTRERPGPTCGCASRPRRSSASMPSPKSDWAASQATGGVPANPRSPRPGASQDPAHAP